MHREEVEVTLYEPTHLKNDGLVPGIRQVLGA